MASTTGEARDFVHDRLDEESTLEDNDSRWSDDIDARESSLTAGQEDDG